MDTTAVEKIVETYRGEDGGLIAMLEAVQAKFSYLPEEALRVVSKQTGTSMVDIYGIATFYKAFSLEQRGRHLVSCCLGTACHVRGAPRIADAFADALGVKSGGTTPDREFTLETVNCLGACALGPIVVIDGHYFSNVQTGEVEQILARAREGLDRVEVTGDDRVFPVEVSCPRCNHGLLDPEVQIDGQPSIRVVVSFGRKHGSLRLSSLYGSFATEADNEIPPETVLDIFCPHCHSELPSSNDCPKCNAPMVPMIVKGGGVVQICSRRGCLEHRLDLDGVNL